MTTRRKLLLALGTGLLASPFAGRAQQKAKVPHIGYMSTGSLKTNEVFLAAFKDGLRELGYVDGKNIAMTRDGRETWQTTFRRLPTR